MTDSRSLDSAAACFERPRPVLIVTHTRPDGDAVGSLYGLALALSRSGRPCRAFLSETVPELYGRCLPETPVVSVGSLPAGPRPEVLVCLDTARADRADLPDGLRLSDFETVINIDHHGDNPRFGTRVWIDSDSAATAQMLLKLLQRCGLAVDEDVATCLLVGVVTDTGGFRFPNTDSSVLRDTAVLIDAGARYDRVMDGLYFRTSYGRRMLEGELLRRAEFAFDGQLIYSVLEPALLERLAVNRQETEGVIDSLRSLDGVEIACLIQPEDHAVRLSLRSRSERHPVKPIATELGGGGHPLAAGARLENTTVADVTEHLLRLVRKVLDS